MSDATDPRDELVSAVLDGEATDAEVAAVRDDAALTARLDELAAVRARLQAEPVPTPPSGAADTAVARAIESASPRAVAPVVTHSRWRRAAPALAAAAAVFVVLFGILALTRSTPSSTKSTAAAGGAIADSSTTTVQTGALEAAAAQARAADGAAFDASSLGAYNDSAALVDAARNAAGQFTNQSAKTSDNAVAVPSAPPTTTIPGTPAPPTACAPPRGTASLVLSRSAQLDGVTVQVFVYADAEGLAVIAVDAATCESVITATP